MRSAKSNSIPQAEDARRDVAYMQSPTHNIGSTPIVSTILHSALRIPHSSFGFGQNVQKWSEFL